MFVGIDVSKDQLDVATVPAGAAFRVPNTPEGLEELVGKLRALAPELVVLEAAGGFERPAVLALTAAGIPARIVDPARARNFARSLGQHSKTDALDARVLARFAQAVRPDARTLPEAKILEPRAVADRRTQLVGIRSAEKNRLHQAKGKVADSLRAHVAWLDDQIDAVETSIEEQIKADPDWGPTAELLRSIPGVGGQTATALISQVPELGALSRKQVAALVGLAPFARDSGTASGTRTIFGGRATARAAPYMAALASLRCNPELRTFYDRLRKAGKRSKVAVVAVARKLLTIANAMIRTKRTWEPSMATTKT